MQYLVEALLWAYLWYAVFEEALLWVVVKGPEEWAKRIASRWVRRICFTWGAYTLILFGGIGVWLFVHSDTSRFAGVYIVATLFCGLGAWWLGSPGFATRIYRASYDRFKVDGPIVQGAAKGTDKPGSATSTAHTTPTKAA